MDERNVPDYAIGDVQGCYDALQRLLDEIDFNEHSDRLWFVGDLVNRGPQSLEVLRFVKQLPRPARITLGNHDLHLLNLIFINRKSSTEEDTLQAILAADDCDELGHWLRQQSLLYHDADLNAVMSHAGIAPMWNLSQAKALALELESALAGDTYLDFLSHMYGNTPDRWSPELAGMARLRVICNYFTRMRFCRIDGSLALDYKKGLAHAPADLYPWYALPNRKDINADIIFGHWAALDGACPNPTIHAIDTGCVWGRTLTALCLQSKQRIMVSGL